MLVIIFFAILYAVPIHFFFADRRSEKVLSANEYCISQGWDKASGDRDSTGGFNTIKCTSDKGFGWYRYPPMSDLQKYCQGTL